MSLIKSKKRVADHGEVFTPAWMVDAMLDRIAHHCDIPETGNDSFHFKQRKKQAIAA